MKIEQESQVGAPRDRVWSLLEDVPRAAGLIPGVSNVVETGPNTYSGKMETRVGPMKISLDGVLRCRQFAVQADLHRAVAHRGEREGPCRRWAACHR